MNSSIGMYCPRRDYSALSNTSFRKLKKSARPIKQPDNPYRLVSAADCRMMAFETVSDAARLWIKGREFMVARLLGDVYRAEAEKYTGGALAIFRLAPQDYHRFHSPVDGTIGPMTYIDGEYYTVNVSIPSFSKISLPNLVSSLKPFSRHWMSMSRTSARSFLSIVRKSVVSWPSVSGQ